MPIATTCPKCQALFRLPDELAGRKVKCQKCAAVFVMPSAGSDMTMPGTPVLIEAEPALVEELQTTAASAASPPAFALPPLLLDEPSAPPKDDFAADDRYRDSPPDRLAPPTKSDDDRRAPRNRRGEKPKAKSSKAGVVLGILGLLLLGFITCAGATGIWWAVRNDGQRARPPIAREFRQKEIKNPPFVANPPFPNDGFNGVVENRPDFDGFKDGKQPEPPPEGPAGSIRIIFGKNGTFKDANKITQTDPKNLRETRHKLYFVRLEAGFTYQFDMTTPDPNLLDPFLVLRDENGKYVAENDDIQQGVQRNSRLIYTPIESGIFQLEATYWAPGPGQGPPNPTGPYTLIVRHVK
jgi:predicted Zn finger-like uncharacterized protein